ncbi:MAG: hypothetical protein GEU97_23745 [Actinophytocola sp.]|nr:hypothetical protein [Actinophytocola sp.]
MSQHPADHRLVISDRDYQQVLGIAVDRIERLAITAAGFIARHTKRAFAKTRQHANADGLR